VIATMDIGAIGFYSGRRIIDLKGLVTPELAPLVAEMGGSRKRAQAVYEFLSRKRPDYIAVFPEEYPGLVERDQFVKIWDVRLANNQIAALDRMAVYQCMWEAGRQ